MEQKNKKNILIVLVVILAAITIYFFIMIIVTKNQFLQQNQEAPAIIENKDENLDKKSNSDVIPLTDEEREKVAAIKNITGKVISVSLEKIVISTSSEEISLDISQETSFVNQKVQGDGSFLIKEINISDLKEGETVDVQYNSADNKAMLVTIKE